MSENHSEISSVHGEGDQACGKQMDKTDEKEARIDTAIKQLKEALMSDADEKYAKSQIEKEFATTRPKVQFESSDTKRDREFGFDQRPPISSHDAWLTMRLRNLGM